jgi:hypothetical protein
MTPELGLLIGSVAAVAAIGATAIVLARTIRRSAKQPPPMLLVLRITLGIIFAILGVIGSVLPIMQGWIFFLLAALVLFPKSRFAIKACEKIEPKMPRLVARLRRWGIGIPKPS